MPLGQKSMIHEQVNVMASKPKVAPTVAAPKKRKLNILPISAAEIRDPAKFSLWVFGHSSLILQELFNVLPDAPPGEQIKVLHALYSTSLSFRPYSIVQEPKDGASDPASVLEKLLRQTNEQAPIEAQDHINEDKDD
jgi:hypothetical protein